MIRLLCGLFVLALTALAHAAERPNVIIILADDLGYADIGPFGGTKARTPHLDRMAREGMRLTSHYAAPVCSPCRAALMTGCYPKRALPIPHVLFPASEVGLHPDEVTIAEVMKGAGYATACIGKWHLGDQPEFLPTRQGFDSYFGLPYSNDMGTAADGSKSNPGQPIPMPKRPAGNRAAQPMNDEYGLRGNDQPPLPLLENEKVIERVRTAEQATLTKRYSEKARAFIRGHRDEPFFLYLPHTAVHFPHYPAEGARGRSGNGLLNDWIEELDDTVGELFAELREQKLEEKTIVFFTSDNGGSIPHGSVNTPLRGTKGQTFEGGIRTPLIAWGPGRIPAGTSSDEVTAMMDFLPTVAALAGAQAPTDRTLDGRDISPVLLGREGARSPHEAFYYFRGLALEAVRSGPWKLHLKSGDLYHLGQDIGERENMSASHPDEAARLRTLAARMEGDLGLDGRGPGCRALGRHPNPQPLIPSD